MKRAVKLVAARAQRKSGLLLATAAISIAMFVQLPLAMSQEKERSATVVSGETVRIWFGANYGRRCATAGPPVFNLISKPSLGEVTTELADYTVPSGQNCAGRTYTGLRILYKAESTAGTDTFKYHRVSPRAVESDAFERSATDYGKRSGGSLKARITEQTRAELVKKSGNQSTT
ncbi:MAG: hypothetical protein ABW172_12400 [Candidatus Binatia bacterium]